jgi:hypothetical protein
MVATKTLEMFNDYDNPMIAQCPWLLACSFMGGVGWEYDAWVSGVFMKYGTEKPVVRMLQENPPGSEHEDVEYELALAEQNISAMRYKLSETTNYLQDADDLIKQL